MTLNVRILCKRSASFKTTTRGSSAIASNILRTVSERCRRFISLACWRRCSSSMLSWFRMLVRWSLTRELYLTPGMQRVKLRDAVNNIRDGFAKLFAQIF